MVNHTHYTYRVTWSPQDKEYIALCAEFPSLSHLDTEQAAALEGISTLVKEVVSDMDENGEVPPCPIGERNYSGKFQVRITPEMHSLLAMQAAEQGVSLNRLISGKLA